MPRIVFGVVLQHPPNREAPASLHFLTYDTKSSPIIPSDFCQDKTRSVDYIVQRRNRATREFVQSTEKMGMRKWGSQPSRDFPVCFSLVYVDTKEHNREVQIPRSRYLIKCLEDL